MRKHCGSGTVRLSRSISALFFLGGLPVLRGMVWQVGLSGLVASCAALGLWSPCSCSTAVLSSSLRRAGPARFPAVAPGRPHWSRDGESDGHAGLIIDEADRWKMAVLEQVRDIFDPGGIDVVCIGMPGIEKRA